MTENSFDAAIIGGGIVALTSAIECARRGLSVALVHGDQPGMASTAAAGMLAPSIEASGGAAGAFAFAARDMYPEFIANLEESTGSTIAFDRGGILELVALGNLVHASETRRATVVTAGDLRSIEPGLRFEGEMGALLYPDDGWVDNVSLMRALWVRVRQMPAIREVAAAAERVSFAESEVQVGLTHGVAIFAEWVVLAAGAWVNLIEGLPRAVPVEPRRGQMLSIEGVSLRHVIIGATGYAVPRHGSVALLGSTMERAGFDPSTTLEGVAQIRRSALEISATLGAASETRRWAGLRPVTPDLLPIVGADPDQPRLFYACGHSRNGILLGPLTGRCIGALLAGEDAPEDLSAFQMQRFSS